MKNYLQPGDRVTMLAPRTLTSGAGALVGTLFGVASHDAASGASVVLVTTGVFDLVAATHASTQAIAAGAAVYWDNTNFVATATASGNTLIGVAVEAKVSTVASVRVRLNGVSRAPEA